MDIWHIFTAIGGLLTGSCGMYAAVKNQHRIARKDALEEWQKLHEKCEQDYRAAQHEINTLRLEVVQLRGEIADLRKAIKPQ